MTDGIEAESFTLPDNLTVRNLLVAINQGAIQYEEADAEIIANPESLTLTIIRKRTHG